MMMMMILAMILIFRCFLSAIDFAIRYSTRYSDFLSQPFLNEKLVTPISADNKCKLSIGTTPTVSRYIKARKTHILGNVPALPDHDPRWYSVWYSSNWNVLGTSDLGEPLPKKNRKSWAFGPTSPPPPSPYYLKLGRQNKKTNVDVYFAF